VPKRLKDDPLTAAQRRLQAGEEVVLVDEGKFLLPTSWQYGDAVLVAPAEGERHVKFASTVRDFALLTLMPDPGTERYRLTARLRQLPYSGKGDDVGESAVGLFWGYRESVFGDGVKARAFMALRYSEVQPNPAKVRKTYLSQFDIGQVELPLNQWPYISKLGGPSCPLDFVPQLPGPWRELTADVSAGEVTLHLPDGPRTLRAADLTAAGSELEQKMRATADGRELGLQNWSPRSPIGVYVDRSRVAVERFVIGPIPPR
jgi:hypothetical protein